MTKFYTRKGWKKDWVCKKTVKAFVPVLVGKHVEFDRESYRIDDISYLIKDDEVVVQVYLEAK